MLKNTPTNTNLLTAGMVVTIAAIAGTLVSKQNRPFLWAAGALAGFMASAAFVPLFMQPKEVVLEEKKNT